MKKIIILYFASFMFLFADIGNLRVIVDLGQKENLSTVPCNQATINNFPFLNKDKTDTTGVDIINHYSDKYYYCSPDINNKGHFVNLKPTIILFNDSGIKGTPSMFNRKLLASASLNKLLFSYLLNKNLENQIGNVYDKNFLVELSKFNPNNFYLAITGEDYKHLVNEGKLNNFFTFLDKSPQKLKTGENSFNVFKTKIRYIKDLYKFGIDIYKKILPQNNYINSQKDKFLHILPSGFIQEDFCNIPNNCRNYLNSYKNRVKNSIFFNEGNLNYWKSSNYHNQCNQSLGYQDCRNQTSDAASCLIKTCLDSSFTGINNDAINFQTLSYNAKVTIKNADNTINKAKSKKASNNKCRNIIEDNIKNTFLYYANKFKSNEFAFDKPNYPLIYNFDTITMDIHKAIPTNNIFGAISPIENNNCINGSFPGINSKNNMIYYVNTLRYNGENNFINYSNKLSGLNIQTSPKVNRDNVAVTSLKQIGSATSQNGIKGLQLGENAGNIISNKPIPIKSGKCASDESVLVLFIDSLSNTYQSINQSNNLLNKELNGNASNNYFNLNYDTYIGCYKNGSITKYINRLNRNNTLKNKALLCYNKWLNEPNGDTPTHETLNPSSACLDYWYNTINQSSNVLNAVKKAFYNEKKNDDVVFGTVLHNNIYNSSMDFKNILNGPLSNTSSEFQAGKMTYKQTPIFKNLINTVSPLSYTLETYPLKEIVCNKTANYSYHKENIIDPKTGKVTGTKDVLDKGTYECEERTVKQPLVKHILNYNYNVQDYFLTLNSYTPISLSAIPDLFLPDNNNANIINLNNTFKAFNTNLNKNKKINIFDIYTNKNNFTKESFEADAIKTIENSGNNNYYSDYNTPNQSLIKAYFPNLVNNTYNYTKNAVGITFPEISLNDFLNNQFDSIGIYFFTNIFLKQKGNYTLNDLNFYEIDHKDMDNIINQYKNLY